MPGKGAAISNNSDQDNTQSDQQKLINGAQVWDFIQQNNLDEVITYCKADVERCRAVYKRLTFAGHIKPSTWVHTLQPETETTSSHTVTSNNESYQFNAAVAN